MALFFTLLVTNGVILPNNMDENEVIAPVEGEEVVVEDTEAAAEEVAAEETGDEAAA